MAIRATMAERRVVILDCCYAGRAQMGRTDVQQLADRVAVDRTCLLLAAAEDEQAIAPPGARYTAFTGELIDLLTRGIDKGPRLLDIQTLWDHLHRRLTASGYPGPELRAGNAGENLPIAQNPVPHSRDRHGQVLYASPYVSDPDLHQAVVLILRHNPGGGTVGVVINRPTTTPVSEVASNWYDLCSIPPVVFAGGPVTHEGHIPLALLRPYAAPPLRFRPVSGRLGTLALSAPLSTVEDLVEGVRLFSGYVGWGPGELEADIAQEVLIPTTESPRVVFSAAVRTLWQHLQRPR
jgi:putative transcriptional regulator